MGRLAWLLQNRLARWRHGAQLEQISSQGMVVNGFSNHWVFRFVNLPAATPRVLIVHDSPRRFDLEGQPPLGWALEKMARYSHFIFCSQRVAGEWMELEELAGKVHCCIPNCCREEEVRKVMKQERAAVRKGLRLPAHRFVVVCPASIQYRKGQDLLVDSMPVLQNALPDLVFYLVGEPIGDWSAALKKRITDAGYGKQIHLAGPRKDALDYIYAADAVVLPARSEAAPLVVLEAMALKTPVIAAAVGGVPDMVEHGRSGLLFAAEDRQGLVESLTRLAKNPLQRKTLAENASARYWAQFSRDQMSTRYAAARCAALFAAARIPLPSATRLIRSP